MDQFDKVAFQNRVRPLLKEKNYEKVAAALTPYVKVRLYEQSFADQILHVRKVSEKELIAETDGNADDSYYVVGHVEQGTAKAVSANFVSRPFERYIAGQRYKIPVGTHESPIASKNTRELLAYDYDILSDAQTKDVFALGNLRDWKLIQIMNDCVDMSQRTAQDIVDVNTTSEVQIQKVHFRNLSSVLETGGRNSMPAEDRLKTQKFLAASELMNDLAMLDTTVLGDNLAEEMFRRGVQVQTVLGVDYITSIKSRMLTEHEHVTRCQIDTTPSGDVTFTVLGTQLTVGSGADAQAVADVINGSGLPVRAEAINATIFRVIADVEANDNERAFIGSDPAVDFSGSFDASILSKGWDRYDVLWAFPSPEYLGEIIRISGQDIETEMWHTHAENTVHRRSTEWFGMGIGNYNGVSKLRIQRARHIS